MLPAWVFASAFWIVAAPAGVLAGTVEHHPEVRLTLELQDRPLHQALETVAELAGMKIEVTGFGDLDRQVTASLRHRTLQQSLEMILRPRSYVLFWMPENLLRVYLVGAGSNDVTVDWNLDQRRSGASSEIPPPPAEIPPPPAEIEAMWLNPPARSPSAIEVLPPPVSELLGEQKVPGSAGLVIIPPPSTEIQR